MCVSPASTVFGLVGLIGIIISGSICLHNWEHQNNTSNLNAYILSVNCTDLCVYRLQLIGFLTKYCDLITNDRLQLNSTIRVETEIADNHCQLYSCDRCDIETPFMVFLMFSAFLVIAILLCICKKYNTNNHTSDYVRADYDIN